MFKIHKDKFFYIGAMLLATIVMAIGQNIIDVLSASAVDAQPRVDLTPITTENAGAGEDDGTDILGFMLAPEEAEPVTAEGSISDFLVPYDESENQSAGEGQSFKIEGRPVVLIYHTHTTEAYRQTNDCTYRESGDFRTKEQDKNIVAVGEKLKSQLESLGFIVYHNVTDHEPPKLATSYDRSVVTMEKYKNEYNVDIFIDLHRDAASVEKNSNDVVIIDGKRCARLMFVVGKGTKYQVKPDFSSNFKLASLITDNLEDVASGLTRDVRVKDGRYNQHLSSMSLLVEVGHNANTLEEAMNSVYYLASAISSVVQG